MGIGAHADMDMLGRFSPARTPVRLEEMRIEELFLWAGGSDVNRAGPLPGEKILIGVPDPTYGLNGMRTEDWRTKRPPMQE